MGGAWDRHATVAIDPSGYFCLDPGTANVCFSVLASVFSFIGFGGSHPPPPPPRNYCYLAGPTGCVGPAPSKFKTIFSDIFGLPKNGIEESIWGGCRYCLYQDVTETIESTDKKIRIVFTYSDNLLDVLIEAIKKHQVLLDLHRDGDPANLHPGTYNIAIVVDPKVRAFQAPSADEIRVNPEQFGEVSEHLALSMGHELVHIGDWTTELLKHGSNSDYLQRLAKSEIRAFDWEYRHVDDVYIGPKAILGNLERQKIQQMKQLSVMRILGAEQ
ncbi:MAG: hypothetical protein OEV58_15435 [Gammaproteobacteria bacterium]|nr:hypothetical protein [Gammaproteobacteria bacterium]